MLGKISVIIPVYRHLEPLTRCLEALMRQTLPFPEYEVIIVDNEGAGDLPRLAARFTNVYCSRETRVGSYAARNHGFTLATGTLLAFTDADCIPDERWLETGRLRYFSGDARQIIAGRVEAVFRRELPNPVEFYDGFTALNQKRFVEVFHAGATANLFVSRKIFAEAGGFDASLRSAGDFEWCRRAVTMGASIVYANEVVVAHPARFSLAALRRRAKRVTGGKFSLWKSGRWISSQRTGRLAYLKLLLRSPLLTTPGRKLAFLGVAAAVQLITMVECCRLLLGGEPERN